jgi:tetratricopeptide (TPR) repeat protein
LAKQEYERSLRVWKIAVEQKPTHGQAWTNMILLLDNMGKTEEALQKAIQALRYLPKYSPIHFNLGNILGKKGNFYDAQNHFQLAINEDPTNFIYYTNLGHFYYLQNIKLYVYFLYYYKFICEI